MSVIPAPTPLGDSESGRRSSLTLGRKAAGGSFLAVPMTAFPEAVIPLLAAFDENGDGSIDIDEMAKAAHLYAESKKTVKRMARVIVVGSVLLCGVLAAMAGLTFVVVDRLKDTSTTDGYLTTKDGSSVVSVSARVDVHSIGLSSWMTDAQLRDVRYVDTYSYEDSPVGSGNYTGAWTTITLPVTGFTRNFIPASISQSGRDESIVTLLTVDGAVVLNGTDMTFELNSDTSLLSAYGRAVTAVFPTAVHVNGRRRLQQPNSGTNTNTNTGSSNRPTGTVLVQGINAPPSNAGASSTSGSTSGNSQNGQQPLAGGSGSGQGGQNGQQPPTGGSGSSQGGQNGQQPPTGGSGSSQGGQGVQQPPAGGPPSGNNGAGTSGGSNVNPQTRPTIN